MQKLITTELKITMKRNLYYVKLKNILSKLPDENLIEGKKNLVIDVDAGR